MGGSIPENEKGKQVLYRFMGKGWPFLALEMHLNVDENN